MGRLACLPVQSRLAHQTPRAKSLTSSLHSLLARFLSATLRDGEGLFAEAVGGAIRRVVGVDSIGRGLLPASAARACLGRSCAVLTHFCTDRVAECW